MSMLRTALPAALSSAAPAAQILTGAAGRLVAAVRETYDGLPLAPHNVASAALERAHAADQRVLWSDQEWAQIETRRHDDAGPGVIMFSDDLTYDDMLTQAERVKALCPPRPWEPFAATVESRPVRRAARSSVRAARDATSRARRGWAPIDAWNLTDSLPRMLAAQLTYLAEHGHGWPVGTSYQTYEQWQAALLEQAGALQAWVDVEDSPAAREYSATLETSTADDVRNAAQKAYQEETEARLAAAQDALRWVAQHLAHLWD